MSWTYMYIYMYTGYNKNGLKSLGAPSICHSQVVPRAGLYQDVEVEGTE